MTETAKNIIHLLLDNIQSQPNVIALRHKQLGIWQQWSWSDLVQTIHHYSEALEKFGLKTDQKILILNEPNIHFFALIFAARILSVQTHFVETKNSNELTEIIQHISPEYIFLDDLAQFNINLNSINSSQIIYFQDRRINQTHEVKLHNFEKILDQNKSTPADLSKLFEDININSKQNLELHFHKFEQQQHYQIAYTEQALILEAEKLIASNGLTENEQSLVTREISNHDLIRYLLATWLIAGFGLNIPETFDTRDQDQKVIAPTFLIGNSEIYGRLYHLALQKLPNNTSWLYRLAPSLTFRKNESSEQTPTENIFSKILYPLFKQSLLESLGYGNLRIALNVGTSNNDTTTHFFQSLGIELKNWTNEENWQSKPNQSAQHQKVISHHDFEQIHLGNAHV